MLIIDRFEGNYAVCEDENRQMQNVELSLIEGNPKEGDIIENNNGLFKINVEETKKRRKYIEDLTKDMWN